MSGQRRCLKWLVSGLSLCPSYLLACVMAWGSVRSVSYGLDAQWDGTVLLEPEVWLILFRTQLLAWSVAILLALLALPFIYFLLRSSTGVAQRYITFLTLAYSISEVIRVLALATLLDAPTGGTPLLPNLFSRSAAFLGFVYIYGPLAVLLFWLMARELSSDDVLVAESLGAKWYVVIFRVIIPSRYTLFCVGLVVLVQYSATDLLIPKLLGGASLSTSATLVTFYSIQARQGGIGLAISLIQIALTAGIALTTFYLGRKVLWDGQVT